MIRRTNLAALTALAALLLTGILAAQNAVTPAPIPPENTLAPDITPFPEFTIEPEATVSLDISNALDVNAGAIRFLLPGTVATGALIVDEPADAIDTSGLPFDQLPAHTIVTLEGYPLEDAHILVFDTADFEAYAFGDDFGGGYPAQLALLERLLAGDAELSAEPALPHLPLQAPPQAFHVRQSRIDFNGGSGILYLAYYTFSVDPIVEGDIVAVFQGLSDDGQTYIAATLPIDTNYLVEAVDPNLDLAAFEEGYETYQAAIRAGLNENPAVSFVPSLDALKAMFASITVLR